MNRRTPRTPRFAPALEGLERRLALSSSSLLISARFQPRASTTADGVDVSKFPLRYRPFTAMFQGTYTIAPARSPGFATQFYMSGGGTSSSFLHGDAQIGYYSPADSSMPAVGMANLMVKNITNSGNQLGMDFQAVPGAVDKAGRPNQFTWTVNDQTGGTFSGAQGSGTMQVIYFPGGRLPRGATSAGRVGVIFRGSIGVTNISDITRD